MTVLILNLAVYDISRGEEIICFTTVGGADAALMGAVCVAELFQGKCLLE